MNTCPAKAGVATAAATVAARNATSTGRAGSAGGEGSARKPRTADLLITTTSEARIGSDVRPTLQGPTTADLHRRVARPPHTPAWTCPAPAPGAQAHDTGGSGKVSSGRGALAAEAAAAAAAAAAILPCTSPPRRQRSS